MTEQQQKTCYIQKIYNSWKIWEKIALKTKRQIRNLLLKSIYIFPVISNAFFLVGLFFLPVSVLEIFFIRLFTQRFSKSSGKHCCGCCFLLVCCHFTGFFFFFFHCTVSLLHKKLQVVTFKDKNVHLNVQSHISSCVWHTLTCVCILYKCLCFCVLYNTVSYVFFSLNSLFVGKYKHITVQYHISDCARWVTRITLLYLQANWTYKHALRMEFIHVQGTYCTKMTE